MNSLGATIKPVPNVSTFIDEDHNCTAVDKSTGQVCGETESMRIVEEFQKLYESRIENVDQEFDSEYDRVCMKLEIMREWIRDLVQQNIMLVQIVEDLEEAACSRVKLLDQKLRKSSLVVSENMKNSNHTEKTINTLSNRISDLEKDEKYMRQRIEFLQSDIRGLLELIRRATQERHWNLDGIKFIEIKPNDIPVPLNCTCDQEETNPKKMQFLKVEIEHLQENEQKMLGYQKQLESKLADLNAKLQTKENTIKKYASELQNFSNNLQNHAKLGDQVTFSSFLGHDQETLDETLNVCVDANTCQEVAGTLNNTTNQSKQTISFLTEVKSLIKQQKENLTKFKQELETIVGRLHCEKYEECCKTKDEFTLNNLVHGLINNIDCLNKTEETFINSILKMENNNPLFVGTEDSLLCADVNRHFKLMDVLRACALEAQITSKDIRDEMSIIVSTFKTRHQKYIDLNKEVTNVQNHLIKSREKIAETINSLQSQEEERTRHNEKIDLGKMKLKDIKNEINHARSRENIVTNYTDTCNDILHSVIEEIEQTSKSIQVFQDQGCCMAVELGELKCQLYEADLSIKGLQQKIDEALLEHDTVERTLPQKEQKLEKLEKEVDAIYWKIEDMYQKGLCTECDENTCSWKYRVTDLQDQVKILQHEANCKQETNDFLRNRTESLEKELHVAQGIAENCRRSHFVDSIDFKKKIIELENALKLQKEMESTLRKQLNDSELELKRSKELKHTEHGIEETVLRCGCNQFRYDTMTIPQLFKTLESAMQSSKCGLQELKMELKKLICKDKMNVCSSTESLMDLMDKFQKYENELDSSFQEIDKLKSSFYSKDKLIEDKENIIRIQKDSIELSQTELKELRQKLQEKIDNQDQIISQYEKEKMDLLRQNELQIQTIGHLQNAVVEAKRCIDQMGQRNMSDLQEKNETICLLTVYAEETQSQYNDCFAEAARQDKLLDLQRGVIHNLQQKISFMDHDNSLTMTFILFVFNSILKTIQEQLEARVTGTQAPKCQKLWQEAEEKLQERSKEAMMKSEEKAKTLANKGCQCIPEAENKGFSYDYDLQSEVDILTRENEDMKKQLQKCKLDFDIIDKELKIEKENDTYAQQVSLELQKMKNNECRLHCENEQLKSDLKKQTKKTEDLWEKLQFVKENGSKFEKLLKTLEDKQMQINSLYCQITNNETVMEKQAGTIKELEKQLDANKKQIKGYLSELNEAEELMTTLHNRIDNLKIMLNEKSNDLAKLQADYEVLKNDNSILQMTNNAFENKTKEDVCQLKKMLKDMQLQLCFTENNYQRVTEDFNKTQDQLIIMSKREVNLQECLTNKEKDYCLKLVTAEKETNMLTDCLHKLRDELDEIRKNYSLKCGENCKLQDICTSYTKQIDIMQQQIEKERKKVQKLEESNHCAMQQLQECMEQNCTLVKEKALTEQNNCEILSELQETHKFMLELKKECQLKNKSLACISAELTETAMSRSELCNKSQYVVSCIRVWMEEQREFVDKVNSKLKSQQQQLLHLGLEKKALLDETKSLKRNNHLLTQRLKKMYRHSGKNMKNVSTGCHMRLWNTSHETDVHIPINSKCLSSQKKTGGTKSSRRVSACGNAWLFPRMKYLIHELRKSNIEYNENFSNGESSDTALEESRDCGYQSSTSK